MEMRSLFNQSPTNHYIISTQSYKAGKSIFFKSKLNVLFTDLEAVHTLPHRRFKLQYVAYDDCLSYEQGLALTKALSQKIPGTGDIKNYDVLYGVTKINDQYYFGILEKDHQHYQKHRDKPYTFSQALDYKLARTLVNIGFGMRKDLSAIDPCCGSGTLILEALSQGYSIEGYDINRTMVFQSNKNLSYYGYDLKVEAKDFLLNTSSYDLCFIDLPYNLYAKSSKESQQALIKHSYLVASRLILISFDEVDVLRWNVKDHCLVSKGKFHRNIYILEKE